MLNSRCCICVVVFLITIMNFIYRALIRQEYKVLFVDLTSSTTVFCSAKGGEINKICLKHLLSKEAASGFRSTLFCVNAGLNFVSLLRRCWTSFCLIVGVDQKVCSPASAGRFIMENSSN